MVLSYHFIHIWVYSYHFFTLNIPYLALEISSFNNLSMKYKVNDAKENSVEVIFDGKQVILNEKTIDLDLVQIAPDKYHVIQDNQSYNLYVLEKDLVNKTFKIKVNDQIFDLNLEDPLDQQLAKMGLSKAANEKIDKIVAPMPGLVLNILVQPGQEVKKGDSLIILEAMKMENVIKSAGTGIVKRIAVQQKDAVEKNQLLIEME